MVAGCEEDVARCYWEDVEEGEDVGGGEEELALREDLLRVGRYGDWGGGIGRVGLGDFAEGAVDGVEFVYGRHWGGLTTVMVGIGADSGC